MHYEELNCHIMLRIHSEKLEFKKYKPDKTGSQVSFFWLYIYIYIYMMIKRNNLKEVEHLEEEKHCY